MTPGLKPAAHGLKRYDSLRDGEMAEDPNGPYVLLSDVLPLLSPPRAGMTEAAISVLAERQRQIEKEGWTPAHDDEFKSAPLAVAAACYALDAACHSDVHVSWKARFNEAARSLWPFDSEWWKPKSQRENLVRAGALILAEIERLDRAAAPQPPEKQP